MGGGGRPTLAPVPLSGSFPTGGPIHALPEKRPKKPQKLRNVHQHPETKNGPYLGLRGSKTNSEGT